MRRHLVAFALALFAILSASAAAPLQAGTLYGLDPFLVGSGHLGNLELAQFLAGNPNLGSYAAKALSADSTSAAIYLLETPSNASVTFTVNSAATLLPYADNFLTTPPASGQSSVTVSNLIQAGSIYYAPVLVQGPLSGYSSNSTISISATQNGTQTNASLALTIPPLVLVHGLWGDRSSLSNVEQYLKENEPWSAAPGYVVPICYSKYLRFDATKDPLSNNNDPCEVTSKSSVQTEVDSLMATLDQAQIVGARVDLVVHSMGGLVARNYASQTGYAGTRDRMQGQFHSIVTLNTPEIGSLLANYLIKERNAKRRAPIWTPQGFIWEQVCGNATVAKCFYGLGYPIYAPSLAVNTGAVYSLEPNSPSLNNPDLSGPDIANATWRAVSSTKPSNSALAIGLDTLIAALYPNPDNPSVPTVDSLLQNLPNDAIVTVDSQIKDAASQQYYTFANLSHTSLVSSLLTWLSGDTVNDNSVTDDPSGDVYKLAGCWVETMGANSCIPSKAQETPVVATATPVQILKPVDRIAAIAAARHATLGAPIAVSVRIVATGLTPKFSVYQIGETGRAPLTPATAVQTGRGAFRLQVTPRLLGPVTLGVRAEFSDGGVSAKRAYTFVAPPARAPLAFRANDLPVLVLRLGSEGTIMPHPSATYPLPVGTIDLNGRFVRYTLVSGGGAIRLQPNGAMQALAPGEATVEAHFAGASDRLHVIVRPAL